MFVDALTKFSDAQTVTTGSENGIISTSSVDLGSARDIGTGEDIYAVVEVNTAMSAATCDVQLVTDDNPGLNSHAVIATLGTFAASAPAGTKLVAKLPPSAAYQRYIAIRYLAGSALSTGDFTAFLTKDAQNYTSYPIGYTVA